MSANENSSQFKLPYQFEDPQPFLLQLWKNVSVTIEDNKIIYKSEIQNEQFILPHFPNQIDKIFILDYFQKFLLLNPQFQQIIVHSKGLYRVYSFNYLTMTSDKLILNSIDVKTIRKLLSEHEEYKHIYFDYDSSDKIIITYPVSTLTKTPLPMDPDNTYLNKLYQINNMTYRIVRGPEDPEETILIDLAKFSTTFSKKLSQYDLSQHDLSKHDILKHCLLSDDWNDILVLFDYGYEIFNNEGRINNNVFHPNVNKNILKYLIQYKDKLNTASLQKCHSFFNIFWPDIIINKDQIEFLLIRGRHNLLQYINNDESDTEIGSLCQAIYDVRERLTFEAIQLCQKSFALLWPDSVITMTMNILNDVLDNINNSMALHLTNKYGNLSDQDFENFMFSDLNYVDFFRTDAIREKFFYYKLCQMIFDNRARVDLSVIEYLKTHRLFCYIWALVNKPESEINAWWQNREYLYSEELAPGELAPTSDIRDSYIKFHYINNAEE